MFVVFHNSHLNSSIIPNQTLSVAVFTKEFANLDWIKTHSVSVNYALLFRGKTHITTCYVQCILNIANKGSGVKGKF